MDCNDLRTNLTEYLYGECDPRIARDINEHLERCEECRRKVQDAKAVLELYREIPAVPPPASAAARAAEEGRKARPVRKKPKKLKSQNTQDVAAAVSRQTEVILRKVASPKIKKIIFSPQFASAAAVLVVGVLVVHYWAADTFNRSRKSGTYSLEQSKSALSDNVLDTLENYSNAPSRDDLPPVVDVPEDSEVKKRFASVAAPAPKPELRKESSEKLTERSAALAAPAVTPRLRKAPEELAAVPDVAELKKNIAEVKDSAPKLSEAVEVANAPETEEMADEAVVAVAPEVKPVAAGREAAVEPKDAGEPLMAMNTITGATPVPDLLAEAVAPVAPLPEVSDKKEEIGFGYGLDTADNNPEDSGLVAEQPVAALAAKGKSAEEKDSALAFGLTVSENENLVGQTLISARKPPVKVREEKAETAVAAVAATEDASAVATSAAKTEAPQLLVEATPAKPELWRLPIDDVGGAKVMNLPDRAPAAEDVTYPEDWEKVKSKTNSMSKSLRDADDVALSAALAEKNSDRRKALEPIAPLAVEAEIAAAEEKAKPAPEMTQVQTFVKKADNAVASSQVARAAEKQKPVNGFKPLNLEDIPDVPLATSKEELARVMLGGAPDIDNDLATTGNRVLSAPLAKTGTITTAPAAASAPTSSLSKRGETVADGFAAGAHTGKVKIGGEVKVDVVPVAPARSAAAENPKTDSEAELKQYKADLDRAFGLYTAGKYHNALDIIRDIPSTAGDIKVQALGLEVLCYNSLGMTDSVKESLALVKALSPDFAKDLEKMIRAE